MLNEYLAGMRLITEITVECHVAVVGSHFQVFDDQKGRGPDFSRAEYTWSCQIYKLPECTINLNDRNDNVHNNNNLNNNNDKKATALRLSVSHVTTKGEG